MRRLVALLLLICLVACASPALAEQQVEVGPFIFRIHAWERVTARYSIGTASMAAVSGTSSTNEYVLYIIACEYSDQEQAAMTDPARNNFMHLASLLLGGPNVGSLNVYKSNVYGANGVQCMEASLKTGTGVIRLLSFYEDGCGFLVVYSGKTSNLSRATGMARGAMQNRTFVVVTANTCRIRGSASISGRELATARKGDRFVLIREEGDFFVVEINGTEGYIHKGVAEIAE